MLLWLRTMCAFSCLADGYFVAQKQNCKLSPTAPAETTAPSSMDTMLQPQATSRDDNFRELFRFCLIEGDSTVFEVKVPVNNNVLDLKDLIYKKGINLQEKYVLAKDLSLWKASWS